MFTKEFVCHLNLAGADARPDDDVGELDQVQDVSLVTAQAHCLSLNLQFYSIILCKTVSPGCDAQANWREGGQRQVVVKSLVS